MTCMNATKMTSTVFAAQVRRAFRSVSLPVGGAVLAWLAVLIYASSNSIVSALVDIGEMNLLADGRNAITHTNLLLLGSLLSIPVLVALYRRDLTLKNVRSLRAADWKMMTLSAVLSSALTPGLFFFALAHTSVTKVVMIGRIEPPLFLLAAYFLLNETFRARVMIASLIAIAGAFVIIAGCDDGGFANFGKGEWAAVAGTVSYVASTIVTRRNLRSAPMGLFFIYRTVIGCAIYFVAVSALFGVDTFRDIFSPVLWNWIWIYAGIALVMGPIVWSMALKTATSEELTLANSFAPLAGVFFAVSIAGETPSDGILPGAAIILISIAYGRGFIGRRRGNSSTLLHKLGFRRKTGAPQPARGTLALSTT